MAEHRRSWWGWGWEDEAMTDDQCASLAKAVSARFGREMSVGTPPTLDDIELPAPRITPPSSLAAIVSDGRYDRAAHSYGKSFRDVVRGFNGIIEHPPDLVALPR